MGIPQNKNTKDSKQVVAFSGCISPSSPFRWALLGIPRGYPEPKGGQAPTTGTTSESVFAVSKGAEEEHNGPLHWRLSRRSERHKEVCFLCRPHATWPAATEALGLGWPSLSDRGCAVPSSRRFLHGGPAVSALPRRAVGGLCVPGDVGDWSPLVGLKTSKWVSPFSFPSACPSQISLRGADFIVRGRGRVR